MNVALYSALYGPYEYVKPLPADLGCRAIMYTDDPAIDAPGWEVRVEPEPITDELIAMAQINDPAATADMLRHKYWKCHPVEAVPDADVTLWVDASLLIYAGDSAGGYAARCLQALNTDDWTVVPHPSRNCIYTEAAFSATLARYDAYALSTQSQAYRQMGHPEAGGLFATGANVRRHTDSVIELGVHWWWEILHRSHQDQVSLPVLFKIAERWSNGPGGDRHFHWNANMPWGAWWGVYEHGRPA